MKTRLSFILLLASFSLLVNTAFGQDNAKSQRTQEMRTLFGPQVSHGGYGALSMGYTRIHGKDAILAGGRLAWVIDHRLALGISGTGYANDITVDRWNLPSGITLAGGHGGFFIEPILFPASPIHLTLPVHFGMGGIAYIKDYWDMHEDWEPTPEEFDAYLLVEPGIELELNVFRFMRLAAGISYRFTDDITLKDLPHDVLNGYSGNVSLKFGKF